MLSRLTVHSKLKALNWVLLYLTLHLKGREVNMADCKEYFTRIINDFEKLLDYQKKSKTNKLLIFDIVIKLESATIIHYWPKINTAIINAKDKLIPLLPDSNEDLEINSLELVCNLLKKHRDNQEVNIETTQMLICLLDDLKKQLEANPFESGCKHLMPSFA